MAKKRIDQILVEKKIVESRSKAQAMIMAGQIFVDKKIIKKSGELFNDNIIINIKDLHPQWVSRGAFKILHALEKFNIKVDNKICLDLGASTGGFTQVLLKNGAKKIYSVDVGTNQLNEKLLNEKKIVNLQKTNARYISSKEINDRIDILVCDVSFISMKKVMEPSLKFLNNNAKIIALIKPQFEARKNEIKKGVVKNKIVHSRICEEYIDWFKNICFTKLIGLTESPIKGPKGNTEFLICLEKTKNILNSDQQ